MDHSTRCLDRIQWSVTQNLVAQALERVAQAAAAALAGRGLFHLVLSGGNTPRALYERLSGLETDWSRWQVWFGDERCLPADHPQRNSRMAEQAWLGRSPLMPQQIHRIAGERGAGEAAKAYAAELAGVGPFDLVLLGLGEDGHTASLFPGRPRDPAGVDVLPVFDGPAPLVERVSLSAARLSDARKALFLVGAGKGEAVAAWRRGELLPAAEICPPAGEIEVLVDPPSLAQAQFLV